MLEAVSTAANIGPRIPTVLGIKRKRKRQVLMTDNDVVAYQIAEEIIGQLFEGGPGSGNWGHVGCSGVKGGSLPTRVDSILASILG